MLVNLVFSVGVFISLVDIGRICLGRKMEGIWFGFWETIRIVGLGAEDGKGNIGEEYMDWNIFFKLGI